MPDDTWRFTDEDCARLRPLVERAQRQMQIVELRAAELADTREGVLEIIQGGAEYVAAQLREMILQQVDRGEWAARGIRTRDEMDVTIHVDAAAAASDTEREVLKLEIQPSARLS